jgi:hypothetical protein
MYRFVIASFGIAGDIIYWEKRGVVFAQETPLTAHLVKTNCRLFLLFSLFCKGVLKDLRRKGIMSSVS